MDDSRFTRLETRVDEIKDDVAEVKAEQKVLTTGLSDLKEHVKEHTKAVMGHVAGDDKIITEIQPIIEEFKFQQEEKRRAEEKKKARDAKLKRWGMRLGIPATLISMMGTIWKVWFSA